MNENNMDLTLTDYQNRAAETAKFPGMTEGYLNYPMTKLAGETGEFLEKVGKHMRHLNELNINSFILTQQQIDDLILELGDIIWYVAILADFLGVTMGEVAARNLDKLRSRAERGVIDGSGDHR